MVVTMVDPQKNLIAINRFTLFLLCAGCVCVTVLVALPHMVKQTGQAIKILDLQRLERLAK